MHEIQVISSKIKSLPGRPAFLLDSDLAVIYGSAAKKINQAVGRNPDRFPEDFVFQLTEIEAESCNFEVTICDLKKDGRGGRRYLPYGFAREGCNMLSAVLNTPVAIARSIQIMRAFSAMERGEMAMGVVLNELAANLKTMRAEIAELKSRPPININLPDDTALPIAIERKRVHSSNFQKGLKFPEVRNLVLSLRRSGLPFYEIREVVREAYPNNPEKWVSTSAAHRFWGKARCGRLKEFGVDVTVH